MCYCRGEESRSWKSISNSDIKSCTCCFSCYINGNERQVFSCYCGFNTNSRCGCNWSSKYSDRFVVMVVAAEVVKKVVSKVVAEIVNVKTLLADF